MKKFITLFVTLMALFAYSDTMNIGYVDSAPFAYDDNGLVVGSDVDIIRSIHRDVVLNYVEYQSFSELIESFEADELDYGIGGASITVDRNKSVLFSIPTEKNELRYLYDSSTNHPPITFSALAPVIGKTFQWLFVALSIFAHTIWAVERLNGSEEHFSKNYFKGISQAYYWSVVTSSTVGYGDITAKTRVGRFLTCIIIFAGIIWFGTFITFLNSEVTKLNSHSGFRIEQDFNAIGAPVGSTSGDMLNQRGIDYIQFNTLSECVEKLIAGRLECMVYDKKPLEFIADGLPNLKMGDEVLGVEYMGIICSTVECKSLVDNHIIKTLK